MDSCLIKRNATTLCSPITQLINRCIMDGAFPDSLKAAVITPNFKGGDQSMIANYEPVSSLPIISKVIEIVVAKQVINQTLDDLFMLDSVKNSMFFFHLRKQFPSS